MSDKQLDASFFVEEIHGLDQMLKQHWLVLQLNPAMTLDRYEELLQIMLQNNYRMVGVFTANRKCIGLSGFWVSAKLYSGKYLEVDNFIVDVNFRSQQLGKMLSDWMQQEALRLQCDTIMLDAYTSNHAAHRFYFREGFHIKSYHFFKAL